MAGPTIKVTLAGDATSLDRALDKAGRSATAAGADFDKAGDKAKGFGRSMDGAADAVDKSEGKFMASADLLDGLGEAFGLPLGGAVGMARAFGDLASGVTGVVIPAVTGLLTKLGLMTAATAAQTTATEGAAVAQTALNTSFSLSPIGMVVLAIGALVAAGVLLVKNWDTIKKAAAAVWQFIQKGWDAFVDFFGGLGARIGGAAKSMFDPVLKGAKAVINAVIGLFEKGLNIATAPFRTAGGIVNFFSSKVGVDIPEFLRDPINLPHLAAGGIVNRPTVALIGERGPEAVVPLGQGGGTTVIQLVVDGRVLTEVVHSGLLDKQRRSGNLGLVSA